ncbi:MAG TPA: DNA-directed RNA polymerase subunit alpha [Patescibacteria group bacterium]
MENIPLPNKIEVQPTDNLNRALVVVEPLFEGYGTTLGNALRRVLLSSLPGAAVTGLKIKGVEHEFSAIDNVKEDVIELILNFKQLRLKIFTDDEVRLKLKVSGQKKATAADIEHGSEVEIVNKDMHLATLTSAEADLEIEIFANKGRGYVPTEARDKELLEIGTIAIDSIYTPIVNVGYKVENVRVGQMTNFEKVIYDIETDGTMTPKDAVIQSADILLDHFAILTDEGIEAAKKAKEALIKKFEEEQKQLEAREATAVEAVDAEKTVADSSAEEEAEEKPKKKRGRPKKSETGEAGS